MTFISNTQNRDEIRKVKQWILRKNSWFSTQDIHHNSDWLDTSSPAILW